MVYFAIEIQFIWEDGIFLATTLLWNMNHAGHGIISNKKVLLLENCLTKLGIIPTGKVVLTWENVEYQFFSIFFFLCNTLILRQKAKVNCNLLSQNLVILCFIRKVALIWGNFPFIETSEKQWEQFWVLISYFLGEHFLWNNLLIFFFYCDFSLFSPNIISASRY